jgi:aerobic carbon-monoxide dehydrogenase large subunit
MSISPPCSPTPIPLRPYRGNGRPEAAFVIERMVDLAADRLGIDPAELRRRNTISAAAMPFKTGLSFTYDSGEFAENMEMALRLADVDGFPARREASKRRGRLRGLGISNTIERAGAPSYEGAEIRFDRGGTVTLLAGSVNQGQGHETVFKQIVCDRLGLDPDDIQYLQGDTDQVFFGEGTGGSRSATLGGSAVAAAAAKVIEKAREIAAFALKVDAKTVKFADGVFSAPATNETLTIKDAAKLAANPARLPAGMEPGLTATAVYRAEVENFPNGCHVCELEIDRDTGEVAIVRYSVVDDVGTVLNPLLLHGQIVGGIAQGVGQILKEDIQFDPASGQLMTGSFMDYAMPRASDLTAVQVKSNPVPTKTNPLGVKGAGEAGTVGECPDRRAVRIRRRPHRNAGHPRAHLARHAAGQVIGPLGRSARLSPHERPACAQRHAGFASGEMPSLGYCNGSCGTSASIRAPVLSLVKGWGPRPSVKATSSARRPCSSPGRP